MSGKIFKKIKRKSIETGHMKETKGEKESLMRDVVGNMRQNYIQNIRREHEYTPQIFTPYFSIYILS